MTLKRRLMQALTKQLHTSTQQWLQQLEVSQAAALLVGRLHRAPALPLVPSKN
jgi:hypothetical protein